eukprot:3231981-Amphidinium_carterae.1
MPRLALARDESITSVGDASAEIMNDEASLHVHSLSGMPVDQTDCVVFGECVACVRECVGPPHPFLLHSGDAIPPAVIPSASQPSHSGDAIPPAAIRLAPQPPAVTVDATCDITPEDDTLRRHRADLVCVSPSGMTIAIDVSVCHCAKSDSLEAALSCRDALKCRAYGATGNGATLPSGECFLPFSVVGSTGHLSAGALTFLH